MGFGNTNCFFSFYRTRLRLGYLDKKSKVSRVGNRGFFKRTLLITFFVFFRDRLLDLKTINYDKKGREGMGEFFLSLKYKT